MLRGVNALVGHDRHRHLAAHIGQPVDVEIRHGLLGKVDIIFEQAANRADRHLGTPTTVGIDAEAHIGSDGRTHRLDPCHIAIWLNPNFDLHGLEALFHRPGRNRRRLIGRKARDRELGGHKVAHRAAQELVERQIGHFAQNVPKRHLDPGLGKGVARQGFVHQRQQPVDRGGIFANQLGGEKVGN